MKIKLSSTKGVASFILRYITKLIINMDNKKRIFLIDRRLIPVSVLSMTTGIGLHIVGHGTNHALWHIWTVMHVFASLLFVLATVAHIRVHKDWYSGLFKNGLGRKSRITAVVSLLFILLILTGTVLLSIEDVNSNIGLWHYRIGVMATVFFVIHAIKRLPMLWNMGKK